jgi:hypothetical protein
MSADNVTYIRPKSPPRPKRTPGESQLKRCTIIAGDRCAGRLLSWIVSWYRKALPKDGRDGLWNANPVADILDGAGLTEKQYVRARRWLTQRGLADIEPGFFNATRMVFTRPTQTCLAAYATESLRVHSANTASAQVADPPRENIQKDSTTGAAPGQRHYLLPFYPSTLFPQESDTDSQATSPSTSESDTNTGAKSCPPGERRERSATARLYEFVDELCGPKLRGSVTTMLKTRTVADVFGVLTAAQKSHDPAQYIRGAVQRSKKGNGQCQRKWRLSPQDGPRLCRRLLPRTCRRPEPSWRGRCHRRIWWPAC